MAEAREESGVNSFKEALKPMVSAAWHVYELHLCMAVSVAVQT